jgi:O-antigen ligase
LSFILTVVYIVGTILSPDQLGPKWAESHILVYVAALTACLSVPNTIANTHLRSSIQTFLLLALIVVVGFSEVVNGWIGGMVVSWQAFLPSAAVFFFIVANVTTARRLKILAVAVIAACTVVVAEALCGYYGGFRSNLFVLQQTIGTDEGGVAQLARLRGPGFLNDPNDLGQMLLVALPLVSLAWRTGRLIANGLFVLLPGALFLWAVYVTHSRGSLIALVLLALVVARKKIGTTASLILIALLVLSTWAVDFTGGRGISVAEGGDRLEAWANGLEMFKSSPIFGIGFGRFTDFNDISAHNLFVLCLAELGLVGSTIWVALIVTTMMGLNQTIDHFEKTSMLSTPPKNGEQNEEANRACAGSSFWRALASGSAAADVAHHIGRATEPEYPDIVPKHWVLAMRLALLGFITTGWFLSSTYKMPMYLALGMATAAVALQRPAMPPGRYGRWIFSTLAVEVAAIFSIYGIVRL